MSCLRLNQSPFGREFRLGKAFSLTFCLIILHFSGCEGATDPPHIAEIAEEGFQGPARFDFSKRIEKILNNPVANSDLDFANLPSAGIRIVPPERHLPAERYCGFRDSDRSSSLKISTTPVAYVESTKVYLQNLRKEAQRGYKYTHYQEVDVDGLPGNYLFLVQEDEGGVISKHYLAFGTDGMSWVVTAVFPMEVEADLTEEVVKSLASIKLMPNLDMTKIGFDVDFDLASENLKPTPGWSKTAVFTIDGQFPCAKPTDPFYKAAGSNDEITVAPGDRRAFAISKIRPSPQIQIQRVFVEREIEVDGLSGFEFQALADDESIKAPILLYAAILFDESSYVLFHGWCGQNVNEDWGAEFKSITRSFKRK